MRGRIAGPEYHPDDRPLHAGAPLARRAAGLPPPPHRGFTILEMILVMAIIGLMVGVSWPLVMHNFNEQQLRESVEVVRAELSRARIRAIDTGLVYQFRYEPDGQYFVIMPYDPPSGDTEGVLQILSSTPELPVVLGTISTDCEFVLFETTETNRPPVAEQLPGEWLALFPELSTAGSVDWGPPLLFYPDGTSMDGMVGVQDLDGRMVAVGVRGLTGSVSVGPVFREATQ